MYSRQWNWEHYPKMHLRDNIIAIGKFVIGKLATLVTALAVRFLGYQFIALFKKNMKKTYFQCL